MSDSSLIKLFTSREIYEQYKKYVKTTLLGDVHKEFLDSFKIYFSKFEHDAIDTAQFLTWFVQNFKSECDDTVIELYKTAWDNIVSADTSVVSELLVKFHEAQVKESIQEHLELEKFNTEKLMALCQKHEEVMESISGTDVDLVSNDLTRICNSVNREHGLRWRLDCLNKSIGPLVLGDFIFMFAFVDTGKTRFLSSELTHMASQLEDGKVLYFNNEEPCDRVYKYLYCSTLKRPFDVISSNAAVAQTHYERIMHGDKERIMMVQADEYNIMDIEKAVRRFKPKLIAIDLVNNLASTGGDRHDLAVTSVAWRLRHIAKTYCPVIAVMQADSSAMKYNKEEGTKTPLRYLSFSQLADSKVGLPGKADAIIGIGRDERFPNSRYIRVSKNKLNETGNSLDINLYREVYFDGARCLYLDQKD